MANSSSASGPSRLYQSNPGRRTPLPPIATPPPLPAHRILSEATVPLLQPPQRAPLGSRLLSARSRIPLAHPPLDNLPSPRQALANHHKRPPLDSLRSPLQDSDRPPRSPIPSANRRNRRSRHSPRRLDSLRNRRHQPLDSPRLWGQSLVRLVPRLLATLHSQVPASLLHLDSPASSGRSLIHSEAVATLGRAHSRRQGTTMRSPQTPLVETATPARVLLLRLVIITKLRVRSVHLRQTTTSLPIHLVHRPTASKASPPIRLEVRRQRKTRQPILLGSRQLHLPQTHLPAALPRRRLRAIPLLLAASKLAPPPIPLRRHNRTMLRLQIHSALP